MKQLFTIITVSLAAQFLSAQKNISAFTSLKVYDKIPVELVASNEYKVILEGKNANNVEFVNSGNELKVRMTATKILQGNDIKVVLYYKNIADIQASQGAKITATLPIETEKLTLISNEGSLIDLELKTTALVAKVNTGGVMQLRGQSTTQDIIASTGGKYKAKDLITEIADVATNAGGEVDVNVSQTITAKTRAGGIINVYGEPQTRNHKKVIGGQIFFK